MPRWFWERKLVFGGCLTRVGSFPLEGGGFIGGAKSNVGKVGEHMREGKDDGHMQVDGSRVIMSAMIRQLGITRQYGCC
ncbi:hypothetical protein QBC39DRAFT_352368 [Podospora conica]|nr:hypothetical protein QBC39DRAFT_352368 [Schizothecium conicum]